MVGDEIRSYVENGDTFVFSSVPIGVWTHVLVVMDAGTSYKLYFNGVLESTDSFIQSGPFFDPDKENNFTIGATQEGSTHFFNGTIDELRVWNRALSEEEIDASYNAGLNRLYRNFTSLDSGEYEYVAYVQDLAGNLNQTEIRTVDVNTYPVISNVVLNSSLGHNSSLENLSVYYEIIDADSTPITITDWRLGGESIAVLNMPFDTEETSLTFDIIRDYSTYQNNATIYGNPVWEISEKVGGAYKFDGDDYINCGSDSSLDITDEITFESWIKTSMAHETGDNFGVLAKALNPDWTWQLRFGGLSEGGPSDRLGIQFNQDNVIPGVWVNLDQDLTTGQWYHVVGVYNGTSALIYLNGDLKDTALLNQIQSSNSPLLIAQDGWNNYFSGTIDGVRIFNRSLSEEQIKILYDSGMADKHFENLSSFETKLGDNWSVALTPNDALGDGETVLSNTLEIINSAPEYQSINLLPSLPYTKDHLQCGFNVTDFDSPLLNVEVKWYSNGSNFLNQTISDYTQSTLYFSNLSYTYTHYDDDFYCRINANDGVESTGWYQSQTRKIRNYSTSLSITDEDNQNSKTQVLFTANYSETDSNVDIGDLGIFLWDTGNIGKVRTIRAIDLSKTGRKDGLIIGINEAHNQFFNALGVNVFNSPNTGSGQSIFVGDLDSDNYEGEFLEGTASISVINNLGQNIWQEGTFSELAISSIGDLDGDGLDDDFVIVQGSGDKNILAYTGENNIWIQDWSYNCVGITGIDKIVVEDLNNDGKDDVVFSSEGNTSVTALNSSGEYLWKNKGKVPLAVGDLDNDGEMEILSGNSQYLFVYNFTGGLKDSLHWDFEPGDNPTEIIISDIYNNGDKYVVTSFFSAKIFVYDSSLNYIWNVSKGFSSIDLLGIDIDDDTEMEFIAMNNNSQSHMQAFIIESNGGIVLIYDSLKSYPSGTFGPRPSFGKHPELDAGDFNYDGVADIGFVSYVSNNPNEGYLDVIQDSRCKIDFNDSVSGRLSWNLTSNLWEYNRSFEKGGLYKYNITCHKGAYEEKISSGEVFVLLNSLPTVTLVSPANDSSNIDRTPTFVWDGVDADGEADIQEYELEISCSDSVCSPDDYKLISIITGSPVDESYTLPDPDFLQYLFDNTYYYTWRVRARDSVGWGDWSEKWNLKIQSEVSISITDPPSNPDPTIDFGTMQPDETKATDPTPPNPFTLENDGNCIANVDIKATQLWNTRSSASSDYRYKVQEKDTGSFTSGTTSWANIPIDPTEETFLVEFKWNAAEDEAYVDLELTVPGATEGAGSRSSTLTFTASLNE